MFHTFLYVYWSKPSLGSPPRLRRQWRGQQPSRSATPAELGPGSGDRNLRMDRDGRMLEAGSLIFSLVDGLSMA